MARPLPENGFRVTLRHDPFFTTNVSFPCGEEQRSLPSALSYCLRTSTTRTGGDRLTVLYVSTTTSYFIYWLLHFRDSQRLKKKGGSGAD